MIKAWFQLVLVAAMASWNIYSVDINPYLLRQHSDDLREKITYTSYNGDYCCEHDEDIARVRNSSRMIIARNSLGREVGCIRFGVSATNDAPYHNQECELISLFVDTQYRKKGIGRELMRLMLETLKPHCSTVEWISRPDAVEFYSKLGALPCHDEIHQRFCIATSQEIEPHS